MSELIVPKQKDTSAQAPSLAAIEEARARLGDMILTTPTHCARTEPFLSRFSSDTRIYFKLECWQYGGTFKPRGALMNMLSLNEAQLARGVTAVSAGNHAVAVSYAAKRFGTHAKVIMPRTANPMRVAKCHAYGAEVVFTENVSTLFDKVAEVVATEGRSQIHPYEGENVALGTGTLGLEFSTQVPELEAVVIAIGGGGLASGASAAIRQHNPHCKIYGVEPIGANTMSLSFESGQPEGLSTLTTIADSLAPPTALPYSFSLCSQFIDGIVTVTDDELRESMRFLFEEMKLALEPAGAAAFAAISGPLKPKILGKRVGVLICGSNIDIPTFTQHCQ